MLKPQFRRAAVPAIIAALGLVAASQATAAPGARTIPANTVVHVQLDDEVSTRTAARGDHFMATLADRDYSGFPQGTRFEGTVTEVRRSAKNQPGILDVRFHRAILPGGAAVPIGGTLASLDDKDVRRTHEGRLESSHGGNSKFETKWVGYGAAGGAVLSTIFGGSFLKGALLGAAGGAVYSYLNKEKRRKYSEVELARGTDFGIRLTNRVAFNDNGRYRYASYEPDRDSRSGRDRNYDERDRDPRDRDRDYDDRDRDREYRDR